MVCEPQNLKRIENRILMPVIPSFYEHKFLQNDCSTRKTVIGRVPCSPLIAALHAFLVYAFFRRVKDFFSVIFAIFTAILCCIPQHVVLQKDGNIHQIFLFTK